MNKKPLLIGAVLLGAVITAIIIAEKKSKYPDTSTPNINPDAPASTEQTIRIMASPERVWQVLSQIDQWTNWQPDISKATLNGPLQEGSSFDWTTSGMGIHSTLHTVIPQKTIGWTGKTLGAFAIHNWYVSALTDGTTEVRVQESMQGWMVNLLGSILQKSLDKGTARWLQALRKAAETE